MVLERADAPAVRHAHDQRHRVSPATAVAHARRVRDELVVRGIDETGELDLGHRMVARYRHADSHTDDAGFRKRGVDDPVLTEALHQPIGHAEDTPVTTHVLAHHDDLGVRLHLLLKCLVDSLDHVEPCHHRPLGGC